MNKQNILPEVCSNAGLHSCDGPAIYRIEQYNLVSNRVHRNFFMRQKL